MGIIPVALGELKMMNRIRLINTVFGLICLISPVTPLSAQGNDSMSSSETKAIEKSEASLSEADEVFKKYLETIGGIERIDGLKSIFIKYEASAMGSTITSEEKRMEGKLALNTYMNGSLFQTVITTQETVFQKQGNEKTPIPDERAIADMKPMGGFFLEHNLLGSGKALFSGIETVNGSPAYRIEVPGQVLSLSLFYDTESGLKVKEIQNTEVEGNTYTQTAELKDYKQFDNFMFPSLRQGNVQGQTIVFKLIDVKINQGVSEADFD